MPLSAQGTQSIKSILDAAVLNEGSAGCPGLVFHAVDRSGKTLAEHAAGTRGLDSKEPMDQDTIFWIASCTKLVTAIAVLQLVEQGQIPLDDAEFVKKHAPETSEKKVYADGVTPADQQNSVTMRMLLSHTAGFGYAFIDGRTGSLDGLEGMDGTNKDVINSRMVNQPGSMWEYGINLDWAGIILERLTNQTLGDYFTTHIFTPLDIPPSSISMFPSKQTQTSLAHMHQRNSESGRLEPREHLYSAPLKKDYSQEEKDKFFQSGGAGLFAKPKEYTKILAAILNEGTSPTTGKTILKKETVELMWKNQIPNQPNFARGGPPPANPHLISQTPEFYPQPNNPPQGWSFGGFLTIERGPSGRGRNTLWWMGLANCFWWVDRERGVAGMLAGQVLPNPDPKVVPAWFGCEKAIYDHLE